MSQVLQWNTNAPFFSVSSNSSSLNVTVWLWSFGQTISKSFRSLISLVLESGNRRLRLLEQFFDP